MNVAVVQRLYDDVHGLFRVRVGSAQLQLAIKEYLAPGRSLAITPVRTHENTREQFD